MHPPQKSPEKPPLITPSASPPPRPSLFSHAYNRLPDAAPPLKRQRLVSTPYRAPHDISSSSTSRLQSPTDVQREREASKIRLLDVWSSLAERYTRRLDEDDIVDIRTGEITQDRGFIRNSRKVDFGAIAAPVTGDATADEGTDEDEEDEYDVDELDAFADTTLEIDNAQQSEMRLRVRPVPPVTALDPADAEDLRAFLEAEQRRKQLCGSDVEEHDHSVLDTQSQGSEVEDNSAADFEDLDPSLLNDAADTSETYPSAQSALYVDSASEDELDNWDIDESSVVYPVLKREDSDSDIEIIDGPIPSPLKYTQKEQQPTLPLSQVESPPVINSKSPSKPHAVNNRKDSQHDTLREGSQSPRPSDPFLGDIMIPEVVKAKSIRRSSSRSQRLRPTPKSSISGSGSESGNSSDSEQGYSRQSARSHCHTFQFPHHPHHPHQSYTPSPHRKQQQHHPPPPEMFAPPMPDPRAQLIIMQAMQQLSALVGTPWTPPPDSSIPYTPSRRHQSRQANPIFNTPSYHPHPYPYSYDPNLSFATLPPESPELGSSPEKSSHGQRKLSMAGSRSRGRRVSFKIDDDKSGDSDGGRGRVDVYSSPSNIPSSRREAIREQGRQNTTKPLEGKGKARAETPISESGSEDPLDCRNDRDGKSYLRSRTPGPKIGPPKGIKRGRDSKGRLKWT